MDIREILIHMGFDKKLYSKFGSNFQSHQEVIKGLLEDNYTIIKVFFRDILSGQHPEIESYETELILNSLHNGKSELVPVLVFESKSIKHIFCLELHYAGNPF